MKTHLIPLIAVLIVAGCRDKMADGEAGSNAGNARSTNAHASTSVSQTAPSPIVLDTLIDFRKPAECEMEERSSDFLASLLVYGDGKPARLGRVNVLATYRPAFGQPRLIKKNGFSIAILPVSGLWQGLHMTELQVGMSETDAWFEEYAFAEPFEQVRSKLNNLGFAIREDGSQELPSFSEGARVQLEHAGKGSRLVCWF